MVYCYVCRRDMRKTIVISAHLYDVGIGASFFPRCDEIAIALLMLFTRMWRYSLNFLLC